MLVVEGVENALAALRRGDGDLAHDIPAAPDGQGFQHLEHGLEDGHELASFLGHGDGVGDDLVVFVPGHHAGGDAVHGLQDFQVVFDGDKAIWGGFAAGFLECQDALEILVVAG